MNASTRATLVIASLGSLHCADAAAPVVTATVALRADLPGASDACFSVELRDAAGGAPSRKQLCSTVDKSGVFSVRDEITCASDETVKRMLVNFKAAQTHREGAWSDPCGAAGCAVDVTCGTTTELDFVMANDFTYADWTQTHIALRDGWFGAGFSTCNDDGPLVIGGRDRVAVLTFLGTTEGDTRLHLGAPQINCDGGTTCALRIGDGSAPVDATCSDGSVVRVQTAMGTTINFPGMPAVRYTNLLLELAGLVDSDNTNCAVRYAATVSDGPLSVGPLATYPVASYHATLIDDDGELACFGVNFDDYGDEDPALLSIGYLRGSGLSSAAGAWADEVPALCYESSDAGFVSNCPR